MTEENNLNMEIFEERKGDRKSMAKVIQKGTKEHEEEKVDKVHTTRTSGRVWPRRARKVGRNKKRMRKGKMEGMNNEQELDSEATIICDFVRRY